MCPESVLPFPPHEFSIRVVVFDLGGVFVHVEMDKIIASFSKKFSLSEEQLRQIIFDSSLLEIYQRGQITTKAFYETIREKLGRSFSFESFCRAWLNIFAPNTEMIAFLHTISSHFKMVLLSNTNALHIRYLERVYPFFQLFEHRIYSCDTWWMKPEPEIYQIALGKVHVAPENCLFVDDLLPNVEGAQRVGMQGFHFTNNASFFQFWEDKVGYSKLK